LIITTSGFTPAAKKEAQMTDRAPVTLVDGKLLAEQLAQHEIGIKRRSRPVLQLDEDALSGAVAGASETAPGEAAFAPEMYKSLWPLPGGNQAYVAALEKLVPRVTDQPTSSEFIARLQREFPQVQSIGTAKGYIRVLVALGFVEVEGGRLNLTPSGRAFAETRDVAIVRDALRSRILGIQELLGELAHGARTTDELQDVLTQLGMAWETTSQLGWRIHWLESADIVRQREDGRYELIEERT
jgi:hypothetical protein